MKIKLLIISVICAAIVLPAFALAAPPQLPHIFYGNVTNNGNNVPVNTVIIAKVNGVEKGRITVDTAGKFGGSGALDEKLLVQGSISNGAVVKFYIGDNIASQTASFSSGEIQQLNLTFIYDNVMVDSSDLSSLISDGTFLVNGSDTSASSIDVVQRTVVNVGSSSVTLPQGTVITKIGGGNFDATALTASTPAVGSLSGLTSGVVIDGSLQWGIANLGLQFSSPITISIYVGTSFNGQTLSIVRSTSSSSGWTSDGIVSPATCVVSAGLCTFDATKASYYVAYTVTSTNNGSNGGSSNTTPTPTIKVGDANRDNKVDKYDFALLMSNWGKTGTNVCDFNNDSKVDKYDFALLMSNWGL